MPTVLILGASRGIGLALARQYVSDGWRVIATARTSSACAALAALGACVQQCDVTRLAHVNPLAVKLGGEALDVAILNAGVYGPRHDGIPSEEEFDEVMHTNVLAAMRLMPLLGPRVCAAHGKLAVISSRMGALGERVHPVGTLYRASKAALNSVLVDASLRFGPQGAVCVALHPGWVRTDMGGPDAELSPDQSAEHLRATIASLGPADNGSFLDYDRTPIGW